MLILDSNAFVIGTGTNFPGFNSAIKDAEWIARVLIDPSLYAFPDHQTRLLCGKDAARENIENEFEKPKELMLKSKYSLKSTVVVFFSGYGIRHDGDERFLMSEVLTVMLQELKDFLCMLELHELLFIAAQ